MSSLNQAVPVAASSHCLLLNADTPQPYDLPVQVSQEAMVHLQIVIGTKVGQGLGAIPLAETISAEIIMTAEWIQRGNTAVCARPHLTSPQVLAPPSSR
jgi:hypothetical protein